ncbi:MAG: DUF3106 domain-containing protein [Desulfobacteraceae bacterium]
MPRRRHLLFRRSCIMLLALMIFCYFPSVSFCASKAHIHAKIGTPFLENNEKQMRIHTLLAKKKKNDWKKREDLSPEEKELLEEKYKEWKSLSPEEKKLIRKRLNKWKKMPPEQRELYQRIYQQWQNLTPKERKKLQEDLDRWEYLPPHKKDAIRHQFKN